MKKITVLLVLFLTACIPTLAVAPVEAPTIAPTPEPGFVHPSDSCSDCHSILLPLSSYEAAEGEWLPNDDGSYWYLHSDAEFGGECQSCHPEMGPTTYSCPPENSACRIVIEDGQLRVECEEPGPEL